MSGRDKVPFPEPSGDTADPAVLFARYLDFYRETVIGKVASLSDTEARTSRLPSGWSPAELLRHLTFMERRWFVWGFLGEAVDQPWGDALDERWHVPAGVTTEATVSMLRDVGRRTSGVLAEHPLEERGVPGGRFDDEPPTLAWICFHVLQEYARHAGHLDIAVELAGGELGE
jgi:uncharacterized damage-inducible protein DinB